MQNNTICISLPIREKLNLKKGDSVVLSMNDKGEVRMIKAVTSLEELIGIGKETFKALGGGEAFIKSEREAWAE